MVGHFHLEIKRELGHVELHCSGEGFFTLLRRKGNVAVNGPGSHSMNGCKLFVECRRIGGAEHTNGVSLSHQADANSWICPMIFYRLFTSRGQQF
jgi:hypothetical protein